MIICMENIVLFLISAAEINKNLDPFVWILIVKSISFEKKSVYSQHKLGITFFFP